MKAEDENVYRENNSTNTYNLTCREAEYLALVAMGFKNVEIAKIFFVSKNTVKKTLENIFLKLLAKDRANAVAIAFLHGQLNNCILTQTLEKYNLKEINIPKNGKH